MVLHFFWFSSLDRAEAYARLMDPVREINVVFPTTLLLTACHSKAPYAAGQSSNFEESMTYLIMRYHNIYSLTFLILSWRLERSPSHFPFLQGKFNEPMLIFA